MLAKCLIYLIFAFVTQLITYKIMRRIDKKEREKLKKWEDETIDELIAHRMELKNMPKISDKEENNDI